MFVFLELFYPLNFLEAGPDHGYIYVYFCPKIYLISKKISSKSSFLKLYFVLIMMRFIVALAVLCVAVCNGLELTLVQPMTEVFGVQTNTNHYGNPAEGCMADEVAVRIQGVDGGICAPTCNGFSCPMDVPSGCTAKPQCALQDGASHKKYCAVICNKASNCGEGASCKMIGYVGICTYDISENEIKYLKAV